MNKLALFLCIHLLLLSLPTAAQRTSNQEKTDSLEQVLPTLSDTMSLKVLFELSQLTTYNDPSHLYLNKLAEEAKKQNNTNYQAFVWAKRVEFLYSDFQSDSIFRVGEQGEDFARKHKEYRYLTLIQQTIAKRYLEQKSYALGLDKVQQMYRDALERNDYIGLARASAIISEAYGGMDMRDEQKVYLNESFQWLDRAGNPYEILYVDNYRELATLCFNLDEYDKCLLYTDSLEWKMEEISHQKEELDFSYDHYLVEYFRGLAYTYLGKYNRGLEHIRKAEILLNEAWPEFFSQQINELYSFYYYETGDYSKAYDYNEQALRFYLDNQLEEMAINQYERKGNILNKLGDYKDAISAYNLYIEKNKALNRTEFKYQINEMRTLYDLEKVEMLAEQDRLRLLSSRRLTIALSVGIILLGCIVVLVALNRRRLARKNRLLFRQLEEKDRLLQQTIILKSKEKHEDTPPLSEQEQASRNLFERLERLMQEKQLYTRPDITRKEVAAELFTNENYLFSAIRDHLDMPFNEYINSLRLEHARQLVFQLQPDTTIEEIGLSSGFGTRKTFTRLFRERYGMSPSEFRQIATEERAK